MAKPAGNCAFCEIVAGNAAAPIVFEDEKALAFLDKRPVFPGHTLVIPKEHHETLPNLPSALIPPFFQCVQLLSRAVEVALAADGTFVAINNRVSQSVPHLHVHVVPRRQKDGLRGFFWPRQSYKDWEEVEKIRQAIISTIASLRAGG